ncbi:MAG: hypothetical protein U0350_19200 [Caldilineaceae bacterium]
MTKRWMGGASSLGLLVLLAWFVWVGSQPTVAQIEVQSPLPTPTATPTPCLSQTQGCYTFDFLGYYTANDGTTRLVYRVTSKCSKGVSYLAFGTANWTPLKPPANQTFMGKLGAYNVRWTATNGDPGYPSIKFDTSFNTYSLGKSDVFTLTIGNFNPTTSVQVQVKDGDGKVNATFTLNQPTCKVLPTPTPTPTRPFSPLPTPTPTPVGALPPQAVLPACKFPGGAPPPVHPLSSFTFGAPQVVITHTAPMGIAGWLPDNQTLLINRRESLNNQFNTIDIFNTQTHVLQTYARREHAPSVPVWIPTPGVVAYVDGHNLAGELWVSAGNPAQARLLAQNPYGPSLTLVPDGHRLSFTFPRYGATVLYVWDATTSMLQNQPVDLARWRYAKFGPPRDLDSFVANWRPNGKQIAFTGGPWLFLWDTSTGTACQVDLGVRAYAPRLGANAQWSPDGRYLALQTFAADSSSRTYNELTVLDLVTGELKSIVLPLPSINNTVPYMETFAWTPDSQTISLLGRVTMINGLGDLMGLHLVNIINQAFQRVLPDRVFETTSNGLQLAWSPNGDKLAVQCLALAADQRNFKEDRICLLPVQVKP